MLLAVNASYSPGKQLMKGMHGGDGGRGGGNPSMMVELVTGLFWSKCHGWQTLLSQLGMFFITGEPGHH
jgi:hypothetical protein